jgi:5-methylcytosine-specific restriction enzyme subunit McrC
MIRPKIPVKNLFYLLDPTGSVPVTEDAVATQNGAEALNFLAGRLARLLAERAAAGLHRAYAERAGAGPFLQGRLDLAAQLRDRHGRKDQLHCRYEDFTANVPCNQVPKATAELVMGSPLLSPGVGAALRQALTAFAGVSSVSLTPDSFAAAVPDRLTEAYRTLLGVCRLLAESLQSQAASGLVPYPVFLLDMERVFEQYVTQGVTRALAGRPSWTINVQPLFTANQTVAKLPDIPMRPDLTIDQGGRPVVALDVKWKRGAGHHPWVTEDLYQVLAYATALGTRRAVLVYPGFKDRVWRYPLARASVDLGIYVLRVIGSPKQCDRSLSRLGLDLRQRPGRQHRIQGNRKRPARDPSPARSAKNK